jgi:hypothetical protein
MTCFGRAKVSIARETPETHELSKFTDRNVDPQADSSCDQRADGVPSRDSKRLMRPKFDSYHHRSDISARTRRRGRYDSKSPDDYLIAYAPDEKPLWMVGISMGDGIRG